MHPFSILALGIFVAGYITARWDLVTRLYELAIFAWDHGVVVSKDLARKEFLQN
jgi:phosphatidylinositol glycan class Q protein